MKKVLQFIIVAIMLIVAITGCKKEPVTEKTPEPTVVNPEPGPLVIDISEALTCGGYEDLAILKIFNHRCNMHCPPNECHCLLVASEVAQNGYKITLPNPETVLDTLMHLKYFFYQFNCSNPNTKFADIGSGPIPCDSLGRQLGGCEFLSERPEQWSATYLYVDRDCNVTGTLVYGSWTVSANCKFKKGWNIYYHICDSEKEIELTTTEKPAGKTFHWSMWRYA